MPGRNSFGCGATLSCACAAGTHSCALVTAMITSGFPSAAAAICDVTSVAVSGSETTLPSFAPFASATERTAASNTGAAGMSMLMRLIVLAPPSVTRYFVQPDQSRDRVEAERERVVSTPRAPA